MSSVDATLGRAMTAQGPILDFDAGLAGKHEPKLWWHSPALVMFVVGTSAILLTITVNDAQFRLFWGEPKIVTKYTLLLFEAGILAFSFGALVAASTIPRCNNLPRKWPAFDDATRRVLHRSSIVLTSAALLGYGAFLYLLLKSGFSIVEIFGDSADQFSGPVKNQIGSIPGVSSLVQIGIAATVVSSLRLADKFSRPELLRLLTVLLLATLRAQIYSERLAMLELLVPIVVVFTSKMALSGGTRRTVAKAVPPVLIALVVVIFGLFEYFRSWQFYKLQGEQSFWGFALNRLAGYYATAINNGQVILDTLGGPRRFVPYDTLEAFWSAQGVYQLRLYEFLGGYDRPYGKTSDINSPYFDSLRHYLNPEFNNPSGYEAPFIDYGPVGGIIFLLVLGAAAGVLYRGYCRGWVPSLLIFPMFFTGLVEFPRYIYWTQARCTYAWIGLVAVIIAVAMSRRKAARIRVKTGISVGASKRLENA